MGEFWGCPLPTEVPDKQWGLAWLWTASPTPAGWAGSPLPSNQFGESRSGPESQQSLLGRPLSQAGATGPRSPGALCRAALARTCPGSACVPVSPSSPTPVCAPCTTAVPARCPVHTHSGALTASCARGDGGPHTCSLLPGACPVQLGVAALPCAKLRPGPEVSSWAGLVTFLDLPVA